MSNVISFMAFRKRRLEKMLKLQKQFHQQSAQVILVDKWFAPRPPKEVKRIVIN